MKGHYAQTLAAIVLSSLILTMSALAQNKTPDNGRDWYALGRSLQQQEKFAKALDAYQHALKAHFQPAGALIRMAQVSAAMGDPDAALRHLQQAFEVSPASVGLLPQLGGIPALADNAAFKALMSRADAARHPCKHRAEAAQFDFWLGDWTVMSRTGRVVGHNRVTRDLAGCVVRESWQSAYGDRGTSVNFYDPATRHWHQVWTSENGTITHYEGTFSDGAMHFTAGGFGDADGQTHYRRMTFTPRADGSVRQLIEDSTDGEHWTQSFDSLYVKRAQSKEAH